MFFGSVPQLGSSNCRWSKGGYIGRQVMSTRQITEI